MRKGLIISIIVNILCLPLASIYLVRKIQFYNSLAPKPTSIQNENIFWKIRNSEFKTFEVDSNSIVFIGDSHTQFFEVAEAFNNINCKNRGIALDAAESLLNRINYIANKHPQKIFIQIGINDLLNGIAPQMVADKVSEIVEQIKDKSPRTLVFIQSVFPTNWNKYNDHKPVLNEIVILNNKLRNIHNKYNCTYVDLFSSLLKGNGLNPEYDCGDSLHLNGLGYRLWRDNIKHFI